VHESPRSSYATSPGPQPYAIVRSFVVNKPESHAPQPSARVQRKARARPIFPPESYLKKQSERLTGFVPHRLEDLTGEKVHEPESQITANVVEEIRRRNEAQLEHILEELGVDSRRPDKWATGLLPARLRGRCWAFAR
jgi:hypothetical protein